MIGTKSKEVAKFYQRFVYPGYPLFFRPSWQEAYLSSPAVCQKMLALCSQEKAEVLILGAGEMQAALISPWLRKKERLSCNDLASKSLRRAKIRLGFKAWQTTWSCEDLCHFLARSEKKFDHIDLSGVLHHLEEPEKAVELLSQKTTKNASLKIMVYNSEARAWIHKLSHRLKQLGLFGYGRQEIEKTQELLFAAKKSLPQLAYYLSCLGDKTLLHESRLLDTFMNPLEQKKSLSFWLALFEKNGFEACSLFDRYGELDELKNPLWQFPKKEILMKKIKEKSFENNFELFLRKKNHSFDCVEERKIKKRKIKAFLRQAPSYPFSFFESKNISLLGRQKLWQLFLKRTYSKNLSSEEKDFLAKNFSLLAKKRLARLGLWPKDFCDSEEEKKELLSPLYFSMGFDPKKKFLNSFKPQYDKKASPLIELEEELSAES